MTLKFQRLLVILMSLILISGAVILILYNSKNSLIFFYTPSELIRAGTPMEQKIRIGGLVKKNSINKILTDKDFITFIITDTDNEILIEFNGILPDLFREGEGAVVEGYLSKNNYLIADRVFAKHDENYMPTSIKKQIQKSNYWKKNY